MEIRPYTHIDLLRFQQFANENNALDVVDLIRQFNLEHSELSPVDKTINYAINLDLNVQST